MDPASAAVEPPVLELVVPEDLSRLRPIGVKSLVGVVRVYRARELALSLVDDFQQGWLVPATLKVLPSR